MNNHSYQIGSKVISIISTISIFIIIIHHGIQMYKSKKNIPINLYIKIITYTILVTALILSFYYDLYIFGLMGPTDVCLIEIPCWRMSNIFNVIYWINKTCLHYSYFTRLKVAYQGSMFEINRHFLLICYILSTLYFISYVVLQSYQPRNNYAWNEKYQSCEFSTTSYRYKSARTIFIAIFVSYDLIISVVGLVLFLRPMFRLKMYQDQSDQVLIFKIGLLNGIMIASSIGSYIAFLVTRITILLISDNVINSLCVILMHRVHDRMFKQICCIKRCCDLAERMKTRRNVVASNERPALENVPSGPSSSDGAKQYVECKQIPGVLLTP